MQLPVMTFAVPVALLFALHASAAAPAANGDENPACNGQSAGCSPLPLDGSVTRFIRDIQALADEGNLDDPGTVERILRIRLNSRPGLAIHQSCPSSETPECEALDSKIYTPLDEFWFQRRPEGQDVAVPSMLMGTVARTGDPRFAYSVTYKRICYPGWRTISNETEATIVFDNVPEFACVTEDQLRATLPQIQRASVATDGAVPYFYVGRIAQKTGVYVTLDYVYTVKCLLTVRIFQDMRLSKDMQEAGQKRQECLKQRRALTGAKPVGDERSLNCGYYWNYLPGARQ